MSRVWPPKTEPKMNSSSTGQQEVEHRRLPVAEELLQLDLGPAARRGAARSGGSGRRRGTLTARPCGPSAVRHVVVLDEAEIGVLEARLSHLQPGDLAAVARSRAERRRASASASAPNAPRRRRVHDTVASPWSRPPSSDGAAQASTRPRAITATRSARTLGLVEVVGGQQDRRALALQRLDELPERAAGLGVEPRRRLVEEQQSGGRRSPARRPAAAAGRPRASRCARSPSRRARPRRSPRHRPRIGVVARRSGRPTRSPSGRSGRSPICSTMPIRDRHVASARRGSAPSTSTSPPSRWR